MRAIRALYRKRQARYATRGSATVRSPLAWSPVMLAVLFAACAEPPSETSPAGPCPTPTGPTGSQAYFEFQVAVPARIATGFPRYQHAPLPGEVLFQVVVDPCGFADLSTLRILKSDRPALIDRTRLILATLRFLPAELDDGQRVPQIVQEVFEFR